MPLLLLLLPVLLLTLVAAAMLLMPLVLRQRYRMDHARRRAWSWLLRVNAWGFLLSLLLFLGGAWLATLWSASALHDAVLGTAAGLVAGVLGVALTRFERDRGVIYYTPNRWMALALTLVVAGRIIAGLWWSWRRMAGDAAVAATGQGWGHWLDAGGIWAIAGLLLGYASTVAWGIHLRHRAMLPSPRGA